MLSIPMILCSTGSTRVLTEGKGNTEWVVINTTYNHNHVTVARMRAVIVMNITSLFCYQCLRICVCVFKTNIFFFPLLSSHHVTSDKLNLSLYLSIVSFILIMFKLQDIKKSKHFPRTLHLLLERGWMSFLLYIG